ncbi:hypothetical protein AGDE_13874 [Angomonas deanei]|uniref:Uncharacterized protein n=1 Tax=Angomonas deanei TaxID=59799 RepID=A0A7G2CJL6_9TRYP|nr:hypothetical protein AGDE_13874 [Angomonas deanei]CAD2219247.1 hypothetical protein, conserved [Angomonas deanei]|eukprot:EPY21679.1 hypothetical protein AGDE_13874 [Angomonas deanei]
MVLIISNEKSGEERKVEKDYRYAFTVQQNNVAVFYDSVSNPIPSNESVEEQLQNFETPNQPTFFVTPFEGLRRTARTPMR